MNTDIIDADALMRARDYMTFRVELMETVRVYSETTGKPLDKSCQEILARLPGVYARYCELERQHGETIEH
jgi:hypothetical protein